ncbi:MAG TPA: aminotransferase class I/II-fold pyridoxal phosphate-dependent enzyme [bacterium]
MKIERFEMERFQSAWETEVEYNLADSGVHPLTLAGLVDHSWLVEVLSHEPIGYGYTNGSQELRNRIASLYHGAGAEHVLVTTGAAEANFLVTWALLEPGDEAVVMHPNYMQIPLLLKSWGATAHPWWLRESAQWAPDYEELERLVTPRTKAIFVCNPNNPTGAVLSVDGMNAICEAAARVDAWVVADEVYRGAELTGHPTPSFWDRARKVIVTGGLSKAYGLPGLRIGWIVAPHDLAEALWGYHDYTSIAPSMLSDHVARMALTPRTYQRIAMRSRGILTDGLETLAGWANGLGDTISWVPPKAGAIAFVRYHAPANSSALAERLRREHSVLVVPGDHFLMDGYLRVGFGGEKSTLQAGLDRLGQVLRTL